MLIGYIDPGLISVAVQAAFVAFFGALTAYAVAPWRTLLSLFSRNNASKDSKDSEEVNGSSEQADATH